MADLRDLTINLLGDKFAIGKELGRRPHSRVFVAKDLDDGEKVALRVYEDLSAEDRLRLRRRQARLKQLFGVRGVAQPRLIETAEGFVFEIASYEETLRRRLDKEQRWLVPKTIGLVEKVAEILEKTHSRGIAHGDLKPENVFLVSKGEVRLADFGGANPEPLRDARKVLGELYKGYVSPERLKGEEPSPRTDVHGLGALTYEILGGEQLDVVPLASEVRNKLGDVSLDVQKVVAKALSTSPKDRFSSVEEYAAALAGETRKTPKPNASPVGVDTARYTNICFTPADSDEVIPRGDSLAAYQAYRLRMDIGGRSHESIVERVGQEPLRTEFLPKQVDGHWLEIVVASRDFEVGQFHRWLFLPLRGPSWTCTCQPREKHVCSRKDRQEHLYLSVRLAVQEGPAEMRVSVYYEKNLIQSHRVLADVGASGSKGQRAHLDYNLSGPLIDLSTLPRKGANVMLNKSSDTEHRIVINAITDKPLITDLTDDVLTAAADAARDCLLEAHMPKPAQGMRPAGNLYNAQNEKSIADFVADLRRMAPIGWELWTTVSGTNPLEEPVRTALSGAADIQISVPETDPIVFPWALIYDIPIDVPAAQLVLCKVLTEKGQLERIGQDAIPECPHVGSHQKKNTLCPYGFWGFRHTLEHPPHYGARTLPMTAGTSDPPRVVVGYSLDLKEAVTKTHFEGLEKAYGSAPAHHVKKDICNALEPEDIGLAYFYCHGGYDSIGKLKVPYLGVGANDEEQNHIRPSDLKAWLAASDWPADHWKSAGPLVFINGCHTTALASDQLFHFVRAFLEANAAGVIGTEVTLDQNVATEAATVLLNDLRSFESVSVALKHMRLHLMGKGNVMGLAYTPFCSGALRFKGAA